jgi:ferredoxin
MPGYADCILAADDVFDIGDDGVALLLGLPQACSYGSEVQ